MTTGADGDRSDENGGDSGRRSRNILVDLTPFRASAPFTRMWLGTTISGIGSQMTIVAVALEIFDITGSTFAVGLVGAFSLIPAIVAGLYGGTFVDAFDRRVVGIVSALTAWVSTALIATHSWLGLHEVWVLYVLTAVNAMSFTVLSTSRSAIIPRLLPPRLIPSSSALGGIQMGIEITVGPALAGLLVAWVGYSWTYSIDVLLFTALFLGLTTLPPIAPQGATRRPGFASVVDGLAYLRRAANIRSGFLLDLAAMTFGSPRVLMPAVGASVLGGGAVTVGLLMAAPAVGTLLCGLLSGQMKNVRAQGRALAIAVTAYGAAVGLFGLVMVAAVVSGQQVSAQQAGSPIYIGLALVALALTGAADNVSMIFRQTMMQTAVPDNVRGRMQGIYIVVVTGGPRLGDIFAGSLAAIMAVWMPPLVGAAAIVIAVLAIMLTNRSLWRYDAVHPEP